MASGQEFPDWQVTPVVYERETVESVGRAAGRNRSCAQLNCCWCPIPARVSGECRGDDCGVAGAGSDRPVSRPFVPCVLRSLRPEAGDADQHRRDVAICSVGDRFLDVATRLSWPFF